MLKFREYIETSYNYLQNPITAVAGVPQAIGAGLSGVAGRYRAGLSGNPYISIDNPEKTKRLAGVAFTRGRDWILDYINRQQVSEIRLQYRRWLLGVLEQVNGYLGKQQPTAISGVMMGRRPGGMERALALPNAVIKGIMASAINVFHTMNPLHNPVKTKEEETLNQALKQVLHSLAALPNELAIAKVEEMKHLLNRGGGSTAVDRDANFY